MATVMAATAPVINERPEESRRTTTRAQLPMDVCPKKAARTTPRVSSTTSESNGSPPTNGTAAWPRSAEVLGHHPTEERTFPAHVPGPGERFGDRRDRQHVHQPENHDQDQPGEGPDTRERDRQGEQAAAHSLGQRQAEGGPERRQLFEPACEPGASPSQAIAPRQDVGVDGVEVRAVPPPVGVSDGVVEPHRRAQARDVGSPEPVFLAEPLREFGADGGTWRYQV